jgi:hypothetical protein
MIFLTFIWHTNSVNSFMDWNNLQELGVIWYPSFCNIWFECKYILQNKVDGGFIFFIVYVDDYIVFNNQSPLIHHIKTILFREFEMFNEGALQYTIRDAIIRNYENNNNYASNHISYC